jgi:hypothetical protein
MTTLAQSDVFFVGSIPVDTPEDALRTCATAVGDHVFALSEGETGVRRMWIIGLSEATYSKHPDIEKVDLDHPFSNLFGAYKLKDGVTSVDLRGYLPYSGAIIESYDVFKRLRDDGVIPEGVRLQVAFPTAHAATGGFFTHHADWDVLWPAWNDAVRDEIDRILEVVAPDELAVQLDYCTEFIEINGDELTEAWPYRFDKSKDEKFRLFTSREYLGPMVEGVDERVVLGYHICCGTYPRQPLSPIEDMAPVVRVANALVAGTPRRVDFFHLPVMEDADDAFFEPLRDLTIGSAKVYLGIETGDDEEGLRRRIRSAEKSITGFGVAHFCGYGRETGDTFAERLRVLREGALALQH